MDQDVKRIGIGNSSQPSVNDPIVVMPKPVFTFDSTEIFFDDTTRTFDEEV